MTAQLHIQGKFYIDMCFFFFVCRDTTQLAHFAGTAFITPEEVASMLPDTEMFSTVIDCWSILLNDGHKKQSGGDMRRFCFGLNASVSSHVYFFCFFAFVFFCWGVFLFFAFLFVVSM